MHNREDTKYNSLKKKKTNIQGIAEYEDIETEMNNSEIRKIKHKS